MTLPVTGSAYAQGGGRGTVRPARAREAVRRALRGAAIRLPDVFERGSRLVVAFSGGQDSTCLLHALAHSHRGLELLAVHVDHGLRADSAKDAERVVHMAEQMKVPAVIKRVQVQRGHAGLQDAARQARYAALAEAAHEHQAKAILVAHTADDQAETVLLNLLRGTGLRGLAGMRMDEHKDATRVVRPLLRIARSTTLAYCHYFGLHIVEDASNATRVYTRNRVRLDVLPLLEQFNPAIRDALARMADLVAEDSAALDDIVDQLHGKLARDQGYDLHEFRTLPRALQRRLLRRGLAPLTEGLAGVADAPIEDALDLLQTGEANQSYHMPCDVELWIGPESFTFRRKGWDVTVPRV